MCFWNEADKKHKLFAYSNWSYFNGHPELGQFDALAFYRYDNATKTMEYTLTPGFDVIYENGVTYSLPRVGKDIKVNKWDGGMKNQTTLKWNGHGFDEQPAAKSGQAVGQKWRSMKDFKEGLAPVRSFPADIARWAASPRDWHTCRTITSSTATSTRRAVW